ncbi:hypothetical protein [Thiothrix fructosivorans]|uniref:Uncharacterized protein n=2 Tax=Thiothrix fructosivorans TaxID=111770 RepID=A0A8B0SJU8_9GAMM|nr:hypothetical protein [Thiothrix fructosivorans]QTX11616.1 hypothetical protein J1836_004495 [Thiothrix fructosivorans]
MVIFMYLFILILSVISCFVGFVLEVAEGNICHIQNGRLPNAGVAIFPNIPVVPLIYVLVVWLLNHLYQDLGFIVVATYAVLGIGVQLFQYRKANRQLKTLNT